MKGGVNIPKESKWFERASEHQLMKAKKQAERQMNYMKQIPESVQDAKEILYKQLALLAEESERCEPKILPEISRTMVLIFNSLNQQVH